jgi:hypothetical protein
MALQVLERREEPRTHADEHGVGTLPFGRQRLIDEMLLHEVSRQRPRSRGFPGA